MSLDFIDSIPLNSIQRVRIPAEANCMILKRKRCIFAKSENPQDYHYTRIPSDAQTIHFPEYREHSGRHVFYGKAVFN
jgi:hypothetical protein